MRRRPKPSASPTAGPGPRVPTDPMQTNTRAPLSSQPSSVSNVTDAAVDDVLLGCRGDTKVVLKAMWGGWCRPMLTSTMTLAPGRVDSDVIVRLLLVSQYQPCPAASYVMIAYRFWPVATSMSPGWTAPSTTCRKRSADAGLRSPTSKASVAVKRVRLPGGRFAGAACKSKCYRVNAAPNYIVLLRPRPKTKPVLPTVNTQTHPRPNPTKATQRKAGSARTVVADRLPQRFVRRHLGERPAVVRVREAVGSRVILACAPFLRTI